MLVVEAMVDKTLLGVDAVYHLLCKALLRCGKDAHLKVFVCKLKAFEGKRSYREPPVFLNTGLPVLNCNIIFRLEAFRTKSTPDMDQCLVQVK